MKSWLPALILIALWTTLLTVLFTPEVPDGHGRPHEEIQRMSQGGVETGRHDRVLVRGWSFGAVMIVGFVSLIAWPVYLGTDVSSHPPAIRSNRRWVAFLVGLVLYEIVFAALCLAYHASLADPYQPAFIGPFPAGTAWMLFGLWPLPTFFIVLYVVNFDRWIFTAKDQEQLAELVRGSSQPNSAVDSTAGPEG